MRFSLLATPTDLPTNLAIAWPLAAKDGTGSGGPANYVAMFTMILVLLIVFALLIGLLGLVRKRLHGGSLTHQPRDFTLSDLRALHREGKISNDEFERAKARMVSGIHATLRKEKQPTKAEEPLGAEVKGRMDGQGTREMGQEEDEEDEPLR